MFDAVKGMPPGDRAILTGKIGQKRTKEKEDFDMEDDEESDEEGKTIVSPGPGSYTVASSF